MLARRGLVQPTGTGELTAWAFDAESWVTVTMGRVRPTSRRVRCLKAVSKVRSPEAAIHHRVLTTQTRLSSFSEAVRRSATKFSCFASTKLPFVKSGSRPEPAGRECYPISIVRASWAPGEWPLFAEQIDLITASTQPGAVCHRFHRVAI